jgi:hypothetical protein
MYYGIRKMLAHVDEITDKELTICMSCISYDIASKMKNSNKSFVDRA